MKPLKTELKQRMNPKPPETKPEPFSGKGTKARLNTAAEKHLFKSKYST